MFVYVIYSNKLLLYKHTPAGHLAVPHGPLKKGETPAHAGFTHLNSYITMHGLVEADLTVFHTIKAGPKTLYFLYGVIPDRPRPAPALATAAGAGAGAAGATIRPLAGAAVSILPGAPPGGPGAPPSGAPVLAPVEPPLPLPLLAAGNPLPTDVDPTFNETSIPTLNAQNATGNGPFIWISIQTLRPWIILPANKRFMTRMLVSNLAKLAKKLGLTADNENALTMLPSWATGLFDLKDIKDACRGHMIITRDCTPQQILDDILIADEYAQHYRLKDDSEDGNRKYHDTLIAQLVAATSDADLAMIHQKLENWFPEKELHITQDIPGPAVTYRPPIATWKRPIPNPYRARAYRNRVTTWGDHTVPGSDAEAVYASLTDPEEKRMYEQNSTILQHLVQPQIWSDDATKDQAMTIAVLESLWYCGQNPTMSNDSRCFPAQVVAELREYQNQKVQGAQQLRAKQALQSWPFLKRMLKVIRAALGPSTFRPGPPPLPATRPLVITGPGSGGPPVFVPPPPPPPPRPLGGPGLPLLGGHILPYSHIGSGPRILPGMGLGGAKIPRFVRT